MIILRRLPSSVGQRLLRTQATRHAAANGRRRLVDTVKRYVHLLVTLYDSSESMIGSVRSQGHRQINVTEYHVNES